MHQVKSANTNDMIDDRQKKLEAELAKLFAQIDHALESGDETEEVINTFYSNIVPVYNELQAEDSTFQDSETAISVIKCQGLVHYLNGLQLMSIDTIAESTATFENALSILQHFPNDKDLTEIRSTAKALLTYWQGVASIQNLDISVGIQKLEAAKQEVKKSGKFGAAIEQTLDLMQGEIFFLSGVKEVMQMDYSNGIRHMNMAGVTTEKVASRYFEPSSNEFKVYMGLSRYYKSFAGFQMQLIRFNSFEFDAAKQESLHALIMEAKNYIDGSSLKKDNPIISPTIEMMAALNTVVEKISALVLERLKKQTPVSPEIYGEIRQLILNGQESAIAISTALQGDIGNIWVRVCDNFLKQVGNIERFFADKVDGEAPVNKMNIETMTLYPKEVQKECYKLIAQNELEKALLLLNQYFSNDIDKLKEVIATQQRWSALKQQIRNHLISEADSGLERSKIANTLIEIAAEVS